MGLTIPNLDSGDFDALMREATAKLPALAGGWTEYNPSDPGTTILELLAWMSDIDAYRLNRLRREHELGFLQLLGTAPAPAAPATCLMQLFSANGAKTLPAGTLLAHGTHRFRTRSEVRVQPADVAVAEIRVDDRSGMVAVKPEGFYPFGRSPAKGALCEITFGEAFEGEIDLFWEVAVAQTPVAQECIAWEFYDTDAEAWEAVASVADHTGAFALSGRVSLELPRPGNLLRCRLTQACHYETPPKIAALYPGGVTADQLERRSILLGESSGYAGQRFALPEGALADSVTLYVGEAAWERTESLHDADPGDTLYEIADGTLRFGDGGYGMIPPRGEAVTLLCDLCLGAQGNVGSDLEWDASAGYGQELEAAFFDGVTACNRTPGTGGRDAETIDAAFARLRREMQHPYRAVTAADYEYLALHAPGVHLARARATADRNRNSVSVVVIPDSEAVQPMPSPASLEAVAAFLEERRLLKTRVDVRAPRYVEVRAQVRVVTSKADPAALAERIREGLDAYLHPLSGGSVGAGWGFGEDVELSDIYLLVDGVDGVEAVADVMLNGSREGVAVPDGYLPVSGRHHIRVDMRRISECEGLS